MHRINYKGGDFDYIDSKRVPEIYEKMLKRLKAIMVWENIRDTMDIKNVVRVKKEDAMIYELLKKQTNYIENKVLEEIEKYTHKITSKVVENMIVKHKT